MSLYNWYNHLSQEGKKYGYLVNGSKSWLTVKSAVLPDEAKRVFGDEVNVTTEGQRHSVIGSQEFKDQNCREKSLDAKENSKHYLREQGASLMQPTLFSRRVTNPSRLKITLTLSKGRSMIYFSQHYSVKRNPSLVVCVSLLL